MKSVVYMALGMCALAVIGPDILGSMVDRSGSSRPDQYTSSGHERSRDQDRLAYNNDRNRRQHVEKRKEDYAHELGPESENAPPSHQQQINQAGIVAIAERDARGHFEFDSRMNGVSVKVLVDTGATSVSINRSVARRIGLKLKNSDFKHTATTANGTTKYAAATIREIRIGRIRVRNVRAAVLEDRSLSDVLLGMSFLNKLSKFEMAGNQLRLVQ